MKHIQQLATTFSLHGQKELENGQKKRSFGQKEQRKTMPLAVAAGFLDQALGWASHPSF